MAGVSFTVTDIGLDDAIMRLSKLQSFDMAELTDAASGLLESSVKHRIGEEKTAPDGTPWADWSQDYAETRGSQHSLLVGENNLLESVQSYATGTEAIVGTNLVYGAIHNFGGAEVGKNIPKRQFLGLSDIDVQDLHELVTGSLEEVFQ